MYCKYCGNEVRSGSKFCSKCGERVDDFKLGTDSTSEKKVKKKREVVEAEVLLEGSTSNNDNDNLMYCRHCGQEISENSVICPICHYHLSNDRSETSSVESVMICLFSFFIPLVGFVLWAIFKDEDSSKAKKALISSIIGVVLGLFLVILVFIFVIFIISLGGI